MLRFTRAPTQKYANAAARQAAYRARLRRARQANQLSFDDLRWELGELRKEISRMQKQARKLKRPLTALETAQLLHYIHSTLDKLLTRSA